MINIHFFMNVYENSCINVGMIRLLILLLVNLLIGVQGYAQSNTWKIDAAFGGYEIDKGPKCSAGISLYDMQTWSQFSVGGGFGIDYQESFRYDKTLDNSSIYSSEILLPVFLRFQLRISDSFVIATNLGYSFNIHSKEFDVDRWHSKTKGFFIEPQFVYDVYKRISLSIGLLFQNIRYLEEGITDNSIRYITHKETIAPSLRLHLSYSL